MPLDTPIVSAVPVLKRHAKALEALGLRTLRDALDHHPFRYEDFSKTVPLAGVVPGEQVTVRVRLEQIRNRRSFFGARRVITEAVLADGGGRAKALWFGQYYLVKTYPPGTEVFLAGKAKRSATGLQFVSPTVEAVRAEQTHTGRIVPVYPVSGSLSVKHLRLAVKAALPYAGEYREWLPKEIVTEFKLSSLPEAVRAIHFPKNADDLAAAQERFITADMLLRLLAAERGRRELAETPAVPVAFAEAAVKSFVAALPFAITESQRRAAWDIIKDMGRDRPMNRLLNGDVGSGKTAVAAIAARAVAAAGGQTALLVPTEILARQHAETLARFFADTDVAIALATSSARAIYRAGAETPLPPSVRRRTEAVAAAVAAGETGIVVGTHALLEGDMTFRDLRLAVIDEQHRFGVRQRRALHRKRADGALPHLLSLTATPIPRTLALTVYGDLDVSVLAARPSDHGPVATAILTGESAEVRADVELRAVLLAGQQAFVICPAIVEQADGGREAVIEEAHRLEKILPADAVLTLHGKMKPSEKQRIMERMSSGIPSVLVATTVVEVGVDLPQAVLMVVRSADRFGLAQLHQLRGRVGRGSASGRCLLLTENESPAARERLQAVAASTDGFALAERDLALRGPGDMYGTMQSGMQASWTPALFDSRRVAAVQTACHALLDGDPRLAAHAPLAAELGRFEEDIHRE